MPERITNIALQAFRGIPDRLAIDLAGGRSCVILGDNGTGKSSIADAAEWYFEGQIHFLRKEGRRDAIRNTGATKGLEARVTLHTDGSLGGETTEETPSPQAVRDIGRSELFLLRGRTLAEFVDKTKGEKWGALAELLGLDAINRLRLDLQRASNELEKRAQHAGRELARKQVSLAQHVGEVSEHGAFGAIEALCADAAVEPPDSLDKALSPQWLEGAVPKRSQERRAADLQVAVGDLLAAAEDPVSVSAIESWNTFVSEEKQDVLPLGLYRAADLLLKSGYAGRDVCPLCDQPVELSALAERVTNAIGQLEREARALESARRAARRVVTGVRDTRIRSALTLLSGRERGASSWPSYLVVHTKKRLSALRRSPILNPPWLGVTSER